MRFCFTHRACRHVHNISALPWHWHEYALRVQLGLHCIRGSCRAQATSPRSQKLLSRRTVSTMFCTWAPLVTAPQTVPFIATRRPTRGDTGSCGRGGETCCTHRGPAAQLHALHKQRLVLGRMSDQGDRRAHCEQTPRVPRVQLATPGASDRGLRDMAHASATQSRQVDSQCFRFALSHDGILESCIMMLCELARLLESSCRDPRWQGKGRGSVAAVLSVGARVCKCYGYSTRDGAATWHEAESPLLLLPLPGRSFMVAGGFAGSAQPLAEGARGNFTRKMPPAL